MIKDNLKLRPYQQDVIHQVINNNCSSLIQIPTGGGKTIIAKHIINYFSGKNKKILFLVPKIILMEQTINVFTDLNPQIIHGNKLFDNNHHLFISTIQTISRRETIKFDLIFVDEIHYGFNGQMINKLIEQNQKARIIGLSATPYDKNGKLLHGFDLIINKYDMKYLINNGYLAPLISYELVKPNLSNIKITAGDYNLKELANVVCNKYLITEILYSTKDLIWKSHKTIVFAVNIQHAKLLEVGYKELGFDVLSVHSQLSKSIIKLRLEWFKQKSYKPKILVSVIMLTTGFDLPETDCAVIARPTKSQNLYKQMVGRILRLSKEKEKAIMLDCGNVIENLGMPLEPIKIIPNKFRNIEISCKNCNSNNFKLTKNEDFICWECKECGYLIQYKNINGFKCNKCFQFHNDQNRFFLKNKELFLSCTCGFETLISVSKGNEKLLLKEDSPYLSFEEATEYVRNQNLKSVRKWHFYKKIKPKFIPDEPNVIYKNKGWINWKDWLGINSNYDQKYLSFEKAKDIIKRLNLLDENNWYEFIKLNHNYKEIIPIYPNQYYKNKGWMNWEDWLETVKEKENKEQNQEHTISFKEARNNARNLKLVNEVEWKNFYNKCFPYYKYPLEPRKLFSKEWINWKDWLGLE